MKYGSVCSGIEAATVAWHPLGWKPAFFSEIEPAPRSVLAHHYPDVPCHGDFTTIGADQYEPIDLLVGGTPCQSFSIAGLRGGLDDDRGNLALEFLRLAQRTRPKWLVWENVPGVLSSNGGRDFGSILGGMVECGYGFAYRVLDAQYFGVAQRRRRVFVVGCLGDTASAAAVLFERQSLSRHSAPRREKRQDITRGIDLRPKSKGENRAYSRTFIPQGCGGETAPTLNAAFGTKLGLDNQHIDSGAGLFVRDIMGTLTSRMFNSLGSRDVEDGAVIPVAFDSYNQDNTGHISKTLAARNDQDTASLITDNLASLGVRRLTPRECERLQGFPDDYTLVPHRNKPMTDGPRYKALGNSMAVPVMRWIGERIQMVENLRM